MHSSSLVSLDLSHDIIIIMFHSSLSLLHPFYVEALRAMTLEDWN